MSQMFYPCSDLNNHKQQLTNVKQLYYWQRWYIITIMLWFNFIFRLIFIFFCFKLIISYITLPKNKIR